MDYKRIYDDLILHRQKNTIISGYKEQHHIIPTSLGGSDDNLNKVALTGREHYIAHLLLARFNRCSQTSLALWCMQMKPSKNSDRPCIKSGRMYEWVRKECAKYTSRNNKISSKGNKNSQFGSMWITDGVLNKKISKDVDIPEGWNLGRTREKKPKFFNCDYCNVLFSNKKKKKYCSKHCECLSKPDIVKSNFESLKDEYDKHKCLSKAFNDNNIAYNGNLFKRFFDLYNNAVVPKWPKGPVL